MNMPKKGFSLVELLIVVSIIGVLAGMLLPAVQRTREAANRSRCLQHMRQIGVGLYAYHDVTSVFPQGHYMENGSYKTFYWALRPYVEQAGNDGDTPVVAFLCPSRRDISVGAKSDYGVRNPKIFSWEQNNWRNILNNELNAQPVAANQVGDGLSNTILMAHKGVRPEDYFKHDAVDLARWDPGWGGHTMAGNRYDVTRWSFGLFRDRNENYRIDSFPGGSAPCYKLLASPHDGGMPILFGDGSVHVLGYSKDYNIRSTDPLPTPTARLLYELWRIDDGAPASW